MRDRLAIVLGSLVLACNSKSPPGAAPAVSASAAIATPPPAASSVAPVASASAVSPPAEVAINLSGEEACIPRGANADESFTVPAAIGSTDAAIAFCLGRSGAKRAQHGCFALDVAAGKFLKLPKTEPPKMTKKTNAGGTYTVEALEKSVRVCAKAGGACNDVEVGPFRSHPTSFPVDVSPDGKKLIVARDGDGSLTVDIYDVATGAREKRSGVKERGGIAGDVAWLGSRVMVVACVREGPGCSPLLFDPEKEKFSSAGSNVYGVENPVHHVAGSTWAFIDSNGSEVSLADAESGLKKGSFAVPLKAEVEAGVSGIARKDGLLAIVAGTPNAGAVAIVDLAHNGKLVKKYTPKACK